MPSKLGRFLLLLTSLAPVAFVLGSSQIGIGCNSGVIWIAAGVALVLLCVLMLRFLRKRGEVDNVSIRSVKNLDQEVLTFLITYLLPVLAIFTGQVNPWVITPVSLLVILIVYHTNIYSFNPLLGLVGYHFYEITTAEDLTLVLITKLSIHKARSVTEVVWISDYMALEARRK